MKEQVKTLPALVQELNLHSTEARAYLCNKLSDFNIEAYANCEDNYFNTKAELQSPFPLVITTWCYEVHSLVRDATPFKTYHAAHINSDFDAEFPDIITIPDRDAFYTLIKLLCEQAANIISEEYPFEGDNANLNEIIDLIHFLKQFDFLTNFQ